MPKINNNLRILIPLLYDYYMFDYFRFLIPELTKHDFDITVITFDPLVKEKYCSFNPKVKCSRGPFLLKVLMARYANWFFRLLLWISGWFWALFLKRKYDFVILPWDNKPLWYIISRSIPSLTCHNSTEFIDLDNTIKRDLPALEKASQKRAHRLFLLLDKILSAKLLPRLKGEVLKYRPHLIIDRLMGFRGKNFYLGCSDPDYLTVTGNKIRDNYLECGFAKDRIIVVGHPGYDYLFRLKNTFGDSDKESFRRSLGIPQDKRIFSFFLSPTSFSQRQLEEVVLMVRNIYSKFKDAFFVLKFHPKTIDLELVKFKDSLDFLNNNLTLSKEFKGDEWNAKLILISDFIVQKQSTVGFIAMVFKRPIISYNIYPTAHEDDMYKILDASLHVESEKELDAILDKLDDRVLLDDLRIRQERACEKFCLATDSANKKIAEIIEGYFLKQKKARCCYEEKNLRSSNC